MMYGYYGGFYPFHIFGSMVMVALWIFFIVFMVRMIKGTRSHRMWGNGESALEILKERYAKGEINREEFERMKKDIM